MINNKKTVEIEMEKLFPELVRMLTNGKTLQMEYNHQTGKIKLMECKLKRIETE